MNHSRTKLKNIANGLGVIFDSNLTFSLHQDIQHKTSVLSKSYFLKIKCSEFHCPYELKTVYFSLVRYSLKYVSLIIWFNDSLRIIN